MSEMLFSISLFFYAIGEGKKKKFKISSEEETHEFGNIFFSVMFVEVFFKDWCLKEQVQVQHARFVEVLFSEIEIFF